MSSWSEASWLLALWAWCRSLGPMLNPVGFGDRSLYDPGDLPERNTLEKLTYPGR